jgi:hypothetical protein
MSTIRVGRWHIFYHALDLLTSCSYCDLMTFIDEGSALTLEEVLKIGLKYSRDRPSTANAFAAVRAADAVCTQPRACPLCCTRGLTSCAYCDLMTFIDEGSALTFEEMLKIGLKYSHDRPSTANAFAAVRAADAVCTQPRACPLCCTRGRSPHSSSRNSSCPCSCHGSPRSGACAFHAVHDHEYWNKLGLDEVYHTFAALLEVNCISPHQVLLERKIDDFSHKEAGDAIAARFPHSDVSTYSDLDDSR